MQYLDVFRKEEGRIWTRKPCPSIDDGIIVRVSHKVLETSTSFPSRNIRFLHAAFDRVGERFIAGDHQGNIYTFNLSRNWMTLVKKTKIPLTAIAYTLRKKSEFLVALADYSLRCYDTETKEIVAEMKGHQTAINRISVHMSGRYGITTSIDDAILWDLEKFERLKKLNINENIDITEVFFLPLSNIILTCFKDDSIFGWELDSLTCKFELPIPAGKKPRYRTLVSSSNGRTLAAAGRSRFINLFALDTRTLFRVIELPNKVTFVKQLVFLPEKFDNGSSQILGALCQDGIARFMNITSCKLLFDVGTLESRVHFLVISPGGKHMLGLMDSGDMNIYSLATLTCEVNKPPPPVVKAVRGCSILEDSENSQLLSKSSRKTFSSEENVFEDGIDKERLYRILLGHGEYPSKYRLFIWRSLLQLPENHLAYAALVDKGIHPAFACLHETYPVKSRRLLRLLQRVLSALAHWSPILAETKYLPNIIYAWPLLESLFTEVLTKNEWLCMWDHVLSNHPSFLLLLVAAYILKARSPLLKCVELEDFKYYFSHQNAVNVQKVIKTAYHLMETTDEDIHPRRLLEGFVPLTKGQYPVFNKYPKFIVDYQKQERERIQQEELEYLRQRQLSLEIQKATLHRQQEEEAWYRQQQLLLDAEAKRRKLIKEEEGKLMMQRQRLQSMNRESKIQQLNLLDDVRRKFLHLLRQQREMELRRLNDKVVSQEKDKVRDMDAALNEAEIKNFELELQKRLYEQEMLREYIQSSNTLKMDEEVCRNHEELEHKIIDCMTDLLGDKKCQEAVSRKVQADLQNNPGLVSAMFGPEKENYSEAQTNAKNPKSPILTEINGNSATTKKDQYLDFDEDDNLSDINDAISKFSFSPDQRRVQTETKFMNEVRLLRQRLARESRLKKPPP
ncbi:TBC1 domain family member 31 [Acanthosepion pharaonis]|uniref:TBC1 domain family member 31 n=1 Tax=Acanthosepion pharaonis TaxID=158019 RepID=A0A812B8I3_ACAPH|nr:TBC1 domain family member 31 [Sepia pharaonis]